MLLMLLFGVIFLCFLVIKFHRRFLLTLGELPDEDLRYALLSVVEGFPNTIQGEPVEGEVKEPIDQKNPIHIETENNSPGSSDLISSSNSSSSSSSSTTDKEIAEIIFSSLDKFEHLYYGTKNNLDLDRVNQSAVTDIRVLFREAIMEYYMNRPGPSCHDEKMDLLLENYLLKHRVQQWAEKFDLEKIRDYVFRHVEEVSSPREAEETTPATSTTDYEEMLSLKYAGVTLDEYRAMMSSVDVFSSLAEANKPNPVTATAGYEEMLCLMYTGISLDQYREITSSADVYSLSESSVDTPTSFQYLSSSDTIEVKSAVSDMEDIKVDSSEDSNLNDVQMSVNSTPPVASDGLKRTENGVLERDVVTLREGELSKDEPIPKVMEPDADVTCVKEAPKKGRFKRLKRLLTRKNVKKKEIPADCKKEAIPEKPVPPVSKASKKRFKGMRKWFSCYACGIKVED